jgi:hypothetical protein
VEPPAGSDLRGPAAPWRVAYAASQVASTIAPLGWVHGHHADALPATAAVACMLGTLATAGGLADGASWAAMAEPWRVLLVGTVGVGLAAAGWTPGLGLAAWSLVSAAAWIIALRSVQGSTT